MTKENLSSDQPHYTTVLQTGVAEFKDRGSRFIAYVFPINSVTDFKQCLLQVKKEHPKASHYCFAYRIGTDGNLFRSSDAGEPSGTAGKPILGQIDSKGITNTLIVVVRYFGGTLLGVPGLINAYKSSASMALQVTPLIQKPVLVLYMLNFDYTQMNEMLILLRQFNCVVLKQEMQLFCEIEAGVPKNRVAEFEYKISELPGVQYKLSIAES